MSAALEEGAWLGSEEMHMQVEYGGERNGGEYMSRRKQDPVELRTQFGRIFGGFDGSESWAEVSFRLPDGVPWNTFAASGEKQWPGWPFAFIQTAGSAPEALTTEVRRQEVDGRWRLFAIGRGGVRAAEPTVPLTFRRGEITVHVHPDEVLTAAEAAEAHATYLETGEVPAGYVLRLLEIFDA